MAKKKVLFFMWSYSLGGGAEKILSTVIRNLPKDKYDIDILEIEAMRIKIQDLYQQKEV